MKSASSTFGVGCAPSMLNSEPGEAAIDLAAGAWRPAWAVRPMRGSRARTSEQ